MHDWLLARATIHEIRDEAAEPPSEMDARICEKPRRA
jgi:hypothetical protein